MSLKAHDSDVQICLVHDKKSIAHLTDQEKELFDILKVAEESDYTVDGKKQYQRMKLCVDKYTPFDRTVYIDVDTIWFPAKSIKDLIEHLTPYDFYIGQNGKYFPANNIRTSKNYTYWEDPKRITRYFKLRNPIPQTISGVFYFTKTEFTTKIFKRCLEIFNDKLAPCIKWANGKPDEYCFNVALSESAYDQKNCHFVYFDKTNGIMERQKMYDNFWGMASGGNRLSVPMKDLHNELVDLFADNFGMATKRYHIDKAVVISERRSF